MLLKCEGHCNSTNKMEAAEVAAAFQRRTGPEDLRVKRKASIHVIAREEDHEPGRPIQVTMLLRPFAEGFTVRTPSDRDGLSEISSEPP